MNALHRTIPSTSRHLSTKSLLGQARRRCAANERVHSSPQPLDHGKFHSPSYWQLEYNRSLSRIRIAGYAILGLASTGFVLSTWLLVQLAELRESLEGLREDLGQLREDLEQQRGSLEHQRESLEQQRESLGQQRESLEQLRELYTALRLDCEHNKEKKKSEVVEPRNLAPLVAEVLAGERTMMHHITLESGRLPVSVEKEKQEEDEEGGAGMLMTGLVAAGGVFLWQFWTAGFF